MRSRRALRPAVALLLVTVPLAACGNGGESAVERGDRLLATGSGDAAIAEYKLALRQEGRTP
jgi:hypothetical protein